MNVWYSKSALTSKIKIDETSRTKGGEGEHVFLDKASELERPQIIAQHALRMLRQDGRLEQISEDLVQASAALFSAARNAGIRLNSAEVVSTTKIKLKHLVRLFK
ncbi:hypothetical protein BGX29_007076 [Mortierella sp. GBA35]|nr:hypothetical protein BGX29_007076 [Mortierella sp. GBA35]